LDDDKDDEASSLPPSQCPEIEEFRTLLRQQKVLNNLTEQALRKSQPLVISNLAHEKAELLTAQDLMGTSKVEQLCLQVLSMRICPGGGVVDVPVIDSSAIAEETNQSNVKSSPSAASSILDTDLPEIVSSHDSFVFSVDWRWYFEEIFTYSLFNSKPGWGDTVKSRWYQQAG
jgi:chromatin assembly factor 1 subunit A